MRAASRKGDCLDMSASKCVQVVALKVIHQILVAQSHEAKIKISADFSDDKGQDVAMSVMQQMTFL